MTGELLVYLFEQLVGRLWLDERRRFIFQYLPGWVGMPGAVPLSLALPLRLEPFVDDSARPFFANLLPEADVRRALAQTLGISEQNDFALLAAIGGECAGAVSLLPADAEPSTGGDYVPLSSEALHAIITCLPQRPMLAGEEGVRLSLAGAQNKLPIYLEGGEIFLPKGGAPSSHIIKPPIRDLAGTVENEAFCMELARQVGLPVPPVSILKGDDTLFLIERYDRRRGPDGRVQRLHQEDFCQALGFLPEQKYEAEGGPKLAGCFGLVRERSSAPAADQKLLIHWLIFNLLIGNADAHAKNLSVLFTDQGPRLAPFYDLLSTTVYPHLASRLAMKIGDENRPDWLQLSHWQRFAAEVQIKPNWVMTTLRAMANSVPVAAEQTAVSFQHEHGSSPIIAEVVGLVRERSDRLLRQLETARKEG